MQGRLPDLSRLLPAVQAAAAAVAPQAAAIVAAAAPVAPDTPERRGGTLRDSHTGTSADTASGAVITVVSDASYARYVLEGTDPHEIRGNPTLRWYAADGVVRFARVVQHPGTQANPYGERAAPDAAQLVADTVSRAMAEALR